MPPVIMMGVPFAIPTSSSSSNNNVAASSSSSSSSAATSSMRSSMADARSRGKVTPANVTGRGSTDPSPTSSASSSPPPPPPPLLLRPLSIIVPIDLTASPPATPLPPAAPPATPAVGPGPFPFLRRSIVTSPTAAGNRASGGGGTVLSPSHSQPVLSPSHSHPVLSPLANGNKSVITSPKSSPTNAAVSLIPIPSSSLSNSSVSLPSSPPPSSFTESTVASSVRSGDLRPLRLLLSEVASLRSDSTTQLRALASIGAACAAERDLRRALQSQLGVRQESPRSSSPTKVGGNPVRRPFLAEGGMLQPITSTSSTSSASNGQLWNGPSSTATTSSSSSNSSSASSTSSLPLGPLLPSSLPRVAAPRGLGLLKAKMAAAHHDDPSNEFSPSNTKAGINTPAFFTVDSGSNVASTNQHGLHPPISPSHANGDSAATTPVPLSASTLSPPQNYRRTRARASGGSMDSNSGLSPLLSSSPVPTPSSRVGAATPQRRRRKKHLAGGPYLSRLDPEYILAHGSTMIDTNSPSISSSSSPNDHPDHADDVELMSFDLGSSIDGGSGAARVSAAIDAVRLRQHAQSALGTASSASVTLAPLHSSPVPSSLVPPRLYGSKSTPHLEPSARTGLLNSQSSGAKKKKHRRSSYLHSHHATSTIAAIVANVTPASEHKDDVVMSAPIIGGVITAPLFKSTHSSLPQLAHHFKQSKLRAPQPSSSSSSPNDGMHASASMIALLAKPLPDSPSPYASSNVASSAPPSTLARLNTFTKGKLVQPIVTRITSFDKNGVTPNGAKSTGGSYTNMYADT